MSHAPKINWQLLEHALGYSFQNPELLQRALTHRSFSADHNERFEYLGDALLETVISVALYRRYPESPEGDLTRLRAAIVKSSSLAVIAKQLDLGRYLRLGSGELKSGGKRRESILADAVEAIIAAVYLDSDFYRCEQITLALFAPAIAALPDVEALKDPKTRLQEYLQSRDLPLPVYELVEEKGPEHAKIFTILAKSERFCTTATASSRKKAEQAAAELLFSCYHGKNQGGKA